MIPISKKRNHDSVCRNQQLWKQWIYFVFGRRATPYASFQFLIVSFFATFLSFWFMISVPSMQEYSMNLCTIKLISGDIGTHSHMHTFPRVVRYVELMEHTHETNMSSSSNAYKSVRIDPNSDKYPSKRLVDPLGNTKLQKAIEIDDEYYRNQMFDSDITDDCQLRYSWQKVSSIPTCNRIHEFDLSSFTWDTTRKTKPDITLQKKRYGIIGQGFWSSVFLATQQDLIAVSSHSKTQGKLDIKIDDSWFVFKTLRYRHEFTPRNFNRMRREALIMEHLTASRFVINVYAFCGTSSFSEYGDGKDIAAAIWPSGHLSDLSGSAKHGQQTKKVNGLSQLQKLHIGKFSILILSMILPITLLNPLQILFLCNSLTIATQAAIGLAELHTVDSDYDASIAHTDISPNQYVKVKGIYKLNDFNRARFIPWSHHNETTCTYRVGSNPGKNRAPEEYKLEPQSEKVSYFVSENPVLTSTILILQWRLYRFRSTFTR
jgi:hypothetical protein